MLAGAVAAEALWRLVPDVRPGERPRFLFFAGLFTLVSFAQTVGLAGAEALFLARFGAEGLPVALILASAATVLLSLVYALRVGSVRNDLAAGVALVALTLFAPQGLTGELRRRLWRWLP